MRGVLLKQQGDHTRARQELEAALALRRRYPDAPGYTLATHQLWLADLLREGFSAYADAVALAEAVLQEEDTNAHNRWWAWRTLAYARLGLGESALAAQAAREALALAQQMESPEALCNAYQVLGHIQRAAGQVTDAGHSVAQEWRWARRHGSVEYRCNALANCARVRLLQARQACGLALQSEELPAALPPTADPRRARQHVRSVQRLLGWAQTLAQQLDRAAGRRGYQDDLDTVRQQVEALAALLAG